MEPVADRYRRLADSLAGTIAEIPADAWANPSPCDGWTARDVLAHLVDVHGRFQSLVGRTSVAHPPVEDDPVGAFTAVREQMQADLEDPERANVEYDGRLGRSTFADSVNGFVCFDLLVHRWDLGTAAGLEIELDPRDVDDLQVMVDRMGPVMRENGVVGPALEPPPDASAQTRLLAALGRRA